MTSSVLNLVISGMPSIPILGGTLGKIASRVLNLVISGMPSIPYNPVGIEDTILRFKPCYKWNAFNTEWGY